MAKLDYQSKRPVPPAGPGPGPHAPPGTRFRRYKGHVARIRSDEGPDEAEQHWQTPVILIVAASLIYILAGWFLGGPLGAAVMGIVHLVTGIIQTILLVAAAFLTAALFKISFGEFWYATLRLAAAGLFSGAVMLLVPCFGLIAAMIVFAGLVMHLLDLEGYEAALFTGVYFIVLLGTVALLGQLLRGGI